VDIKKKILKNNKKGLWGMVKQMLSESITKNMLFLKKNEIFDYIDPDELLVGKYIKIIIISYKLYLCWILLLLLLLFKIIIYSFFLYNIT